MFVTVHFSGKNSGGRSANHLRNPIQGLLQGFQFCFFFGNDGTQLFRGAGIAKGIVPLEHHGAKIEHRVVQSGQITACGQSTQGYNGTNHLLVQLGGIHGLRAGGEGILQMTDFRFQTADFLPGGEGGGMIVDHGDYGVSGGLFTLCQHLVHIGTGG